MGGKEGKKKAKPVVCYEDGLGRGTRDLSAVTEELEMVRWAIHSTSVRASLAWPVGEESKNKDPRMAGKMMGPLIEIRQPGGEARRWGKAVKG